MDIDPMDSASTAEEDERDTRPAPDRHLGTWVALTVALLATFLGICKIKDDNIVQAMQQAEADRVDQWSFYQARNLREELAMATVTQLEIAADTAPAAAQARYHQAIEKYEQLAAEQAKKKEEVRKQAESDQVMYDALNYRDDQFDLADAAIAVAISLLAVAALTHKRWLFLMALVPTVLGLLMGAAGLAGWHLHPDQIVKLLT